MGDSERANEKGNGKKTLDDIILGVATSALQIENAVDGAKEHDWHKLKALDGSVLENNIEHDTHMGEDAELIAKYSQLYRFSCDWAKLQEAPFSDFDKKEVERYRKFLGTLKDKGVETMLVMHHFASPMWFSDIEESDESGKKQFKRGGFEKLENLPVFKDYAKKLKETFGDLVDYWNTFNEPTTLVYLGYISGEAPPYKTNRWGKALEVLKNIKRFHDEVYDEFKKDPNSETPIGISNNTISFYPLNPLSSLPSRFINWLYNKRIPKKLNEKVDFIGLAHYGKVGLNPKPKTAIYDGPFLEAREKKTDKMFEKDPKAFKDMIMHFSEMFDKPIFITETGYCTSPSQELDGNDQHRIDYIKDTLKSVKEALDAGADILGCIYWSIFDNFELALGKNYKYGLIEVDSNQNRSPKESARFYQSLINSKNREGLLSEH